MELRKKQIRGKMKTIAITMRQNTSKETAMCLQNSDMCTHTHKQYIHDKPSFSKGNMKNPEKAAQCHKLFHLFDEKVSMYASPVCVQSAILCIIGKYNEIPNPE